MSKAQPGPVSDFALGEFQATAARPAPARTTGAAAYRSGQFEPLVLGQPEEDPRERAQLQARQMVEQAQREVAEAQAQVKQIGAKAYEEGYRQGQQEGHTASQARIEAAMSNLERAAASLARAKQNILGNMEREIVALVQAAVDGVLMTQGALPAKALRAVVSRAVAQVAKADKVTVHCSQADLDAIKEFRPQVLESFSALSQMDLVVDPDLRPGDCLVEAPETLVDATLQTRRQAIMLRLEETLRQGPPQDLAALADTPPPAAAVDDGWDAAPAADGEDW